MSNNKVFVGCGIAAGVVALFVVITMFFVGKKALDFGKGLVAENEKRSAWIAPEAGTSGEQLFPQSIGSYTRKGLPEPSDSVAMLNIQRPGEKAVYGHPTGQFEVYAWEGERPDMNKILADAKQAIDDGSYSSRSQVSVEGMHYSFKVSPPATAGRFYANKGWVFLFLTTTGGDPEPLENAFIDAIDGASHPTAEDEAG